MRKVALWALVVCTLLACGTFSFDDISNTIESGTTEDDSQLVPTASSQGAADENESIEIPPTWTPLSSGTINIEEDDQGTVATAVPGIPPGSETYTVMEGDTLANIAYHYGISVYDLAEANDIENIDLIEVGQVLIIP